MKRILLILSLLTLSLSVSAQGRGCFGKSRPLPFKAGEKLRFSLMYKWGAVNTEVAWADIKLDSLSYEGKSAYHTQLKVQSAPFFDVFFKMREDFQSWFSTDDLLPLKFTRDTYEGGYVATNLFYYDWPARVIHADINFESRGRQVLDIPLKDCASDLPALIYSLRTLDMASMVRGHATKLSFAIDDSVFDVKLTFKGKEKLRVRKMGKMNTYHFSCSVVSGAMFEGDQEIQIWFSADDNRIPVAIMAPLRVGAVWAWIKSYSGLPYPFSARI